MGNIVRRVEQSNSLALFEDTEDALPPIPHGDGELVVSSQKLLGVRPALGIRWHVAAKIWRQGYRLMVFRNTTGFATEEFPEDLSKHGQMIAQKSADGTLIEHLPEGTYFYTLILQWSLRFLKWEFWRQGYKVVLAETIPSAKVAIGRTEDQAALIEAQMRLRRVRKQLEQLESPPEEDTLEARVRRAVGRRLEERLLRVRTQIQLATEWNRLLKELRSDPDWKRLKPAVKKQIREDVERELDIGEDRMGQGL